MHDRSQNIITDKEGRKFIEGDWYAKPLPLNLDLDDHSYPDTSYSFIRFISESPHSFVLGYGSGNYGHSNFIGGHKSRIQIGKYVVLQGTTLIANESITIKDHCMFSWGSIITDSWIDMKTDIQTKQNLLKSVANSNDRHLNFPHTNSVVIEENVWVGFKAVILPGVTVGHGSVIGSCAIVSEDVPPYAIVVGNPARVIRFLSSNDTEDIRQNAIAEYCIK